MKMLKNLLKVVMACLIAISCFACTNNGGGEPEPELSPADISEKAMENFVKKLEAGNYVVNGGNSVVTAAYSPEHVYINYDRGGGVPLSYLFMTLKGETFGAMLEGEDRIRDAYFLTTDNAIDYLGDMLPNYWIKLADGNMWEIFYNDVNKPLEFTTNDERVKKTLAGLAGYNEMAASRMEEVHMELDAMDPTSAHFTAVIADIEAARIYYDDLDLTLEFGTAKADERISAWLKDPVYPPVRTAWTSDDVAALDLAYMRGYGEEAVPFPGNASYAMTFDDKAYDEYLGIRLIDPHFTKEEVENYKSLLRSRGFKEETGTLPDGTAVTVFRHLLREDYRAYSQLYVNDENGLEVIGTLYHDNPEYDGFAAISEAVRQHGFEPLEDTDVFKEWKAVDTAASKTEGWAYFFDYDMYMVFDLEFEDYEAAKAYLENYRNKLMEKGFVSSYVPGENNGACASTNGFVSFTYKFSEEEEGLVRLEFKNEKSLTAEEVLKGLKEHGLPDTDIHGDIAARDHTPYHYELIGFKGLHYSVYQPFASVTEAEKFLDAYIPGIEEQGYYEFDPQKVGSQRQFCWFNEEEAKYVAFDIYDEGSRGMIFFEFVSIEPEEESLMLKSIGRR